MPSRRLSCSARRLSVPAAARTRARSSRSSRATAWNFVRTAGVTRPRRAAASTSRAVRASTETTSPMVADASLLPRGGTASARLALAWSSHRLLLCNAGARRPRHHAGQSRGRGEERPERRAWRFERRADLRISKDQRSGPRQASHADPEPPIGGLVTTARGKAVVGRPVRFSGTAHVNACESA